MTSAAHAEPDGDDTEGEKAERLVLARLRAALSPEYRR
jgi:hypothetical protein